MSEREVRLGIDVACTAAHQASLADERGEFLWQGWRFRTTTVGSGEPMGQDPARGPSRGRDGADPESVGAVGRVVP